MKLENKVALVTGAAHRVGKAIALALAREGADVVVHYGGSAAAARETAAEIEVLGRRALIAQADMSSWGQAQALGRRALDHFGRVDILVNSASTFVRPGFFDTTEADFDRAFDVNVKGVFALTQEVGRAMARRAPGGPYCNVINILDEGAFKPHRRSYFSHGLSKAALLALNNALVGVLGPNARVNAVCPGPVLKPVEMTDAAWEGLRAGNPLGELGTAEQVADAVVWLATGPRFANGTCVMLDGGRIAAGW